jgi:hypothetical protein
MDNPPDVLSELTGVREYVEGSTVRLVRRQQNGRLVIRAFNEGGNNYVDIDFMDLMNWSKWGPSDGIIKP